MAVRSLFIAVIVAVLATMIMAAPANVTTTAQPSVTMTAEVTLQTAQASASASASASPRSTKTAAYSTQGLPASIFPSNSYTFADTNPFNDGMKTLSLQAVATGSD
ncbi:unnamed protein product [Mucor circinelloides]|uniref:Uncharacterized protein n=1 Tax=Mucor circinelloides f. circinelloides (strain 1006PhL) TaxID=1220926 RepID=S2K6E6_MUCC1|nr:hypothetical protein HMPREF1544_02202 [Mucor circinelloides 1006PhL]KAG1101543.1 hypothetical protein G6F42_017494 [Rhizopus arrhizus]